MLNHSVRNTATKPMNAWWKKSHTATLLAMPYMPTDIEQSIWIEKPLTNRFDGRLYSADETACELYVLGNKRNHIYTVNLVATSCSRWVFDTHKQSQRIHSDGTDMHTIHCSAMVHVEQNSSSVVSASIFVFLLLLYSLPYTFSARNDLKRRHRIKNIFSKWWQYTRNTHTHTLAIQRLRIYQYGVFANLMFW